MFVSRLSNRSPACQLSCGELPREAGPQRQPGRLHPEPLRSEQSQPQAEPSAANVPAAQSPPAAPSVTPSPSATPAPPAKPVRRSLLQAARDFLAFLDNGRVDVPYEARQELRRQHLAELRAAVADAERREQHERQGSTLTEVLIAVLILSLGVLPIMSLFVVGTLRMARATQLTQATVLRYNAEAFIDLYPALIGDPDTDGDTAEHAGEKYVVDPYGWIFAPTPAAQGVFGNVKRYCCGRTTEALADEIFTSPDTETPRTYTWLLTARKTAAAGPGLSYAADVDIVVCFRRAFGSQDDERVYAATFTNGSADVPVSYSTTAGSPKPHVQRGGFIFDADNARWYRVAGVKEPAAGSITVTLETPAIVSSPAVAAGGGHAVAMKGVVDVWPVGVKSALGTAVK